MVLIIYYKWMNLIIHFNPGATWLFIHTHSLLFPWTAALRSHWPAPA
jgi:hypothetical protein